MESNLLHAREYNWRYLVQRQRRRKDRQDFEEIEHISVSLKDELNAQQTQDNKPEQTCIISMATLRLLSI
jgi:hypothetical protein